MRTHAGRGHPIETQPRHQESCAAHDGYAHGKIAMLAGRKSCAQIFLVARQEDPMVALQSSEDPACVL